MRVFCAIEIPQHVRARVLQHINKLRKEFPDAKASWNREANIHLTLKFLGEIPESSVTNLSSAAARAAAGLQPFKLQIERTGVFPNQRNPRVLWIGINDLTGRLDELYRRLEDEGAMEGFEREGRKFHPHLTIARLRQPQGAKALVMSHSQVDRSILSSRHIRCKNYPQITQISSIRGFESA